VGKYEAPIGERSVVIPKERGAFPPEFEAKYQAYKLKSDKSMYNSIEIVNGVKSGAEAVKGLLQKNTLAQDLKELKQEGIKLGVIVP
jgi:hypothetical protein